MDIEHEHICRWYVCNCSSTFIGRYIHTPETDVRFVCTILLISHLNTKVHVESE